MKPLFLPKLVNGAAGDPALYVDMLHERRALLFDLGDLAPLGPRNLLRITHIFVSHAHMDHFIGFDRMLRVCLGRDRALHLFGPAGFIAQVEHKLAAYTWNLVQNYSNDFTIYASELHADGTLRNARFECRRRFVLEALPEISAPDGVLLDEHTFDVRATILDHMTPSLAFALREKQHVNVWKSRLEELGLPTGAWLRELKHAILRGAPDATPFRVWWRSGGELYERHTTVGALRYLLHVVAGQKFAYVVDAAFHEANAARIVALAQDADVLYIEAVFMEQDAERARRTYHLTARQAGALARRAAVKRVEPFHFSARYGDDFTRVRHEALAAFNGDPR